MDLLEQYKQQNPKAFQEKKPAPMTDEYGRVYTGMIAFVIRLSGGRIRDARRANYALMVGVVLVISIAILFYSLGSGGVQQPTQGLINRPQPQTPLPR